MFKRKNPPETLPFDIYIFIEFFGRTNCYIINAKYNFNSI